MKKILIIDNYDSFTHNLVYLLRQHKNVTCTVIRNNKITLEEVCRHDKMLLSPGPGLPIEAGRMQEIIERFHTEKPILGICLGYQGMGEIFGCELENMQQVLHGFQGEVNVNQEDYLFRGIDKRITCGRYHSWRIKKSTLKDPLEIIATDDDGEVMGIRHKQYDLRGLQFHPESIMTNNGSEIMRNWVEE